MEEIFIEIRYQSDRKFKPRYDCFEGYDKKENNVSVKVKVQPQTEEMRKKAEELVMKVLEILKGDEGG